MKSRPMPRYLVCCTRVYNPDKFYNSTSSIEDRTTQSWFTLNDELQVNTLPYHEYCGFGTPFESITYEVFEIKQTSPTHPISAKKRTVLDEALHFRSKGGGVDIGLRGPSCDPKGVFWDSRGNSFAIVTPNTTHENVLCSDNTSLASRMVSDQGVILCSVNGIGEVRWTVFRGQETWAENREAVQHFGLTWTK